MAATQKMSLDELEALVKNGTIREDVFQELVRINSTREVSNPPMSPLSPAKKTLSRASLGTPGNRPPSTRFDTSGTSDCFLEGWLFTRKPTSKTGGWKRRLVSLGYTRLEWSDSSGSKKGKNGINLVAGQTVARLEDDVLSFEITPVSDPKVHMQFSADSEADVRKWIGEISRVLKLLKSAGDEKDLPVLLNRPARSESQVARDLAARESAFKKQVLKSGNSLGIDTSGRTIMDEPNTGRDSESVEYVQYDGESAVRIGSSGALFGEDEEKDKDAYDVELALKEARENRDACAAEVEAAILKESALNSKESDASSELQRSRSLESKAFDETNRLRKIERASSERVAQLSEEEAKLAKEAATSKPSSSLSLSQSGASKALQRLLSKDGVHLEADPNVDKLNNLLFSLSNTRKALQQEKDKLKLAEAERAKAENQLRQARNKVAECIKVIQDVVKQKRTISTTLSEKRMMLERYRVQVENAESALSMAQAREKQRG